MSKEDSGQRSSASGEVAQRKKPFSWRNATVPIILFALVWLGYVLWNYAKTEDAKQKEYVRKALEERKETEHANYEAEMRREEQQREAGMRRAEPIEKFIDSVMRQTKGPARYLKSSQIACSSVTRALGAPDRTAIEQSKSGTLVTELNYDIVSPWWSYLFQCVRYSKSGPDTINAIFSTTKGSISCSTETLWTNNSSCAAYDRGDTK